MLKIHRLGLLGVFLLAFVLACGSAPSCAGNDDLRVLEVVDGGRETSSDSGVEIPEIDPDSTDPDGSCIPACSMDECGDDGCGGSCGTCPDGQMCVDTANETQECVPDGTDPDVTDPDATDPDAVDPDSTDPDVTDPDATDPDSTDPDVTDPDSTDPDVTDPDATDPDVTDPDSTDPDSTDPDMTVTDTTITITPGVVGEIHVPGAPVISLNGEGWTTTIDPGDAFPFDLLVTSAPNGAEVWVNNNALCRIVNMSWNPFEDDATSICQDSQYNCGSHIGLNNRWYRFSHCK